MTKDQFLIKLAKLTRGYPLYSQDREENPRILAKLFDIAGSGTWYISEYDPEERIAFGYVTGLAFDEWGLVPLDELIELSWHGISRIEIDRYFGKTRFSEIPSRPV